MSFWKGTSCQKVLIHQIKIFARRDENSFLYFWHFPPSGSLSVISSVINYLQIGAKTEGSSAEDTDGALGQNQGSELGVPQHS